MVTYIVALSHQEFHDYCRKRGLDPARAKLVRSRADLKNVEIGDDRLVFYGRCYELPEIDDLLDFILSTNALDSGRDWTPYKRKRAAAPVYELRRELR
jgi:hypothetical protein